LVSSQFVIHYTFETFDSASTCLRNASESLRIGGYFIGTTVNSCELVERCRASPDLTISNKIFKISFDKNQIDLDKPIDLFGAKYHFSLDEVVNCDEYLVYFPLLVKLASRHGLELVKRQTFQEFFEQKSHDTDHLLEKMQALEQYPPNNRNNNRSDTIDHDQFEHAKKYFETLNSSSTSGDHVNNSCGTLSMQEWEIIKLYITFAFKKVRDVCYTDDRNVKEKEKEKEEEQAQAVNAIHNE